MHISTFTHREQDIEVTFNNGFLAYTFVHQGKNYGAKVEVKSKKVIDIASIAFQLALNAIETYENLRLSEGA